MSDLLAAMILAAVAVVAAGHGTDGVAATGTDTFEAGEVAAVADNFPPGFAFALALEKPPGDTEHTGNNRGHIKHFAICYGNQPLHIS